MSEKCCCSQLAEEPITKYNLADHWIIGELETGKGKIPIISTKLSFKDRFGNALSVNAGVGCVSAVIRGWLTNSEPSCDCSGGSECC